MYLITHNYLPVGSNCLWGRTVMVSGIFFWGGGVESWRSRIAKWSNYQCVEESRSLHVYHVMKILNESIVHPHCILPTNCEPCLWPYITSALSVSVTWPLPRLYLHLNLYESTFFYRLYNIHTLEGECVSRCKYPHIWRLC